MEDETSNFILDNAIQAYEHTIGSELDRFVLGFLKELKQYREILPSPLMVKDLANMNRKHEKNALENAHIVDEYRSKQEQGLLIELPVAEGTIVYEICNNTDACYDCNYYSSFYGMDETCDKAKGVYSPTTIKKPLCEKQYLEIIEFKAKLEWIFDNRDNFGKTVFLTRSEAEEALERMQG